MFSKVDVPPAVTAGLAASLSPLFGDYIIILLVSLCGALAGVSKLEAKGAKAAWMIFRATAFSLFTTATASHYVSGLGWFNGLPAHLLMLPIAFLIALVGDDWFSVKDKIKGIIFERMRKG